MTVLRKGLVAFLFGMLLASAQAWAVIETYEFETEQAREQYNQLTAELRCPKCQNQNIADSNAPIAQDLRREVHRLITQGANNDEIVNYMVERYGDFVIYRPRFDASTFLLWFGPLILGVIGVLVILAMVRASTKQKQEAVLSGDERHKLSQLLNDQENS